MKVEIYKSGILRRGWRWRVTADNGRKIGASTEAYKNRVDCEYNLKLNHDALRKYYWEL